MIERPPLVMWVQGLENLRTSDFLPLNDRMSVSADDTEFIHFLTTNSNRVNRRQKLQTVPIPQCFANFKHVAEGVVDFTCHGVKVRLVYEKFGKKETEEFILNVPEDTWLVITQRPKGRTKKSIEVEFTSSNRLTIDVPMPRPLNVFDLLDKNNWSKECVVDHLANITSTVFLNYLANLIFQLTFS